LQILELVVEGGHLQLFQQVAVEAVEERALLDKVLLQSSPDVELSVQHKTTQQESGTPVGGS
jgi:hypothetical protein